MARTSTKAHVDHAIAFDAADQLTFDVVSPGAGAVNTTLQALMPLSCAFKILGAVIVGGTGTAGITSFNVVLGPGAEGTVPLPDNQETTGQYNVAAAGSILFAVDQAVTLVANVPQTFSAAVPDAIWPKGGLLTLRTVTTGGGAGTLKVALFVKPFDVLPQRPYPQSLILSYATDI